MLLYNICIKLYFLFVCIASLFNGKAKLWLAGRRNKNFERFNSSLWFHFASLGEFEQGRPVLEALRKAHPGKKIVVTFFSPSGYEIRKNTPLADAVYYLPLDTAANARHFIDTIKPEMAIFTKYEYWYHFFKETHERNIPLYIISGIFRPGQVFFKWYGSFNRKILNFVTRFFLQDAQSVQLLQGIGFTNTTISGDTRFDRVWANTQQHRPLPLVAAFKGSSKALIAGSTWPPDEALLVKLVSQHPGLKFIIAPHEVAPEKINGLLRLLPPGSAIKYAELEEKMRVHSRWTIDHEPPATGHDPSTMNQDPLTINYGQILIIDNIGMLSALYAYGDIAYIGGGFGAGIHNTLEAAAFGLPVIFGPNYQKFKEARELIAIKAGFSISNEAGLAGIVDTLVTDEAFYSITGKKARNYVEEHTGATQTILDQIC